MSVKYFQCAQVPGRCPALLYAVLDSLEEQAALSMLQTPTYCELIITGHCKTCHLPSLLLIGSVAAFSLVVVLI